MRIVDQQCVISDSCDLDDLQQLGVRIAAYAVTAVGTEADRFAVHQRDGGEVARLRVLERIECAVVEDRAVLVDLDQRGARSTEVRCLRSLSRVRATNVASAPSASDTGLNGVSTEPIGVDLVIFPVSEVGEYWPLVRP